MATKPNTNSGCGMAALIIGGGLIVILFIAIFTGPKEDKKFQPVSSQSSKEFTFRLTHGMGKELKSKARFTCGDIPTWTLKYDNGEKITYKIISGSEYDPLCGLKAIDSNGDKCEICVSKESDGTRFRFDYGKGLKMVFDGYRE